MKARLLIVIFFLNSGWLYSSENPENPNAVEVDILTWRYFLEKRWDSLLLTGNNALESGIDFYYLRVRMGVASFETERYYPAVRHLKKARTWKPDDDYVNSYLYFALNYTGQSEEAGRILQAMTPETRKAIAASDKPVELTYLLGGITFSSAKNPDNLEDLMGADSIYGEQDLYGDNKYAGLGLSIKANNSLRFNLTYSFLQFDKTRYIQYGQGEAMLTGIADSSWGKSYQYAFPWVIHDTSFSYTVYQHEMHLGATIYAGSGFRIMPAVHLVNVGYRSVGVSYQFDTLEYPAWYTNFDSTLYTFPYSQLRYTFTPHDTLYTNWLASLKISREMGIFSLGLSGSFSKLNGSTQKQIGVSATYFPFGNLHFYGTSSISGFFQKKENRLLLSQIIGARVTPWLWAEGNFHYGDFTNANILNGSVVFNNSDRILYRAGGSLTFFLSRKIQLSLLYQFTAKESLQYYYVKIDNPDPAKIREVQKVKYNPYQTNSIIGGVTWKF
jgi:hypothetical protein